MDVDKFPFSQRDLSLSVVNKYSAQDLINTIKTIKGVKEIVNYVVVKE